MKQRYLSFQDIRAAFGLLKPYIRRQWKAYSALFLLMWADIALTLAFAWFFGAVTDAAVHSQFSSLKQWVPLGVLLLVISTFSSYFNVYFRTKAASGVKRDLETDLFRHLLRLPVPHVAKLRSGEVLSCFTNDLHAIDGAIGSHLLELVRLPLIYTAVFIYLFHINQGLSLLSLCMTPVALFTGAVFGLLLKRNSRLIQNLLGEMNTLLHETLQGFPVIRSFTIEKLLFRKYAAQNRELLALELSNARLSGLFQSGAGVVGSITFLVSLCFGAYYISAGVITVGALLTYLNLVHHLVYPLTGLAGLWAGFQRSAAAVERLSEFFVEPPESAELPGYQSPKPLLKSIHFNNISFGYEGQKKLFDNLQLQLPAGGTIAVVGQSGAGKTTLFHLLQGFLKPQSGSILLDGIPIERLSVSELRSCFAPVPQETFLFDGTIRENLMLARPNVTEMDMIAAAKQADIHAFIMSLPDRYDTGIGEMGFRLSGGQKQRMAIARALLKDAPILLLDEATSALDGETEYQVQEAMERLKRGRTTLIIAHRLSTVRHADLIVVLDQGKIVQTGSHEALIAMDGLYGRLNRMQFFAGKEERSTIDHQAYSSFV